MDEKRQVGVTVIVLMSIGPRMCNDTGVCNGGQKQTFDKRTHDMMYAMIHSCLYRRQIVTEQGISRRQMVCANAGCICYLPHPLVCDRADYFYGSTEEKRAQQLQNKIEPENEPH